MQNSYNSIFDIGYSKERHIENCEMFELLLNRSLNKVQMKYGDISDWILISAENISEMVEKGHDDIGVEVSNLIFDCIMYFPEDERLQAIEKVKEIYATKNYDYANIAEKQLKWDGVISYKIMLEHKVSRFINLKNKKRKVLDEKIEDTILDIVGYSVIYLIWLVKGMPRVRN